MTVKGVAGAIAPKLSPNVRLLADEGVEMTPGQIAGRNSAAKRLEDRGTSLPAVGGKIEAARENSTRTFNIAAANRALKPIGKAVPKSVPAGHEAIGFVQDQLSNEYQAVLSKAKVSLDMTFANRVRVLRARANLPQQQAAQFDEIIQRELTTTFGNGNKANGPAYKKLDEKLGDIAKGYLASDDPYVRQLGNAVADVRDQVSATLRRQNPAIAARLKKIDLGWAQYARLRAASANTADGVFTPGQLRTAVRQLDRSRGKGATARGDALLQDLSTAASDVLPSNIGNSGTADRLATTNPFKWGAGAAASPLYSEGPLNALTQFLTAPRHPAAHGVANALRQLPGQAVSGAAIGALKSPSSR
jgi:hypothetical protein